MTHDFLGRFGEFRAEPKIATAEHKEGGTPIGALLNGDHRGTVDPIKSNLRREADVSGSGGYWSRLPAVVWLNEKWDIVVREIRDGDW